MSKWILGIDQSTQGTKALLFDEQGELRARADRPHRQIIDERGYVEHDPEEIYANTLAVVRDVTEKAGIDKAEIAGVGISNQRETTVAFGKDGHPICNAVVWQCARAEEICRRIEEAGYGELIRTRTGLKLSPYFPAGKMAWILENVPGAREAAKAGDLYLGTVDSYLVYRLTKGQVFKTDVSNASRTQLLDLKTLSWDPELCRIFGIPVQALAQPQDSDGDFGETDFDGWLDVPIPIRGVLGDSHGALFGQGCHQPGMTKTTYGTGSSVMMNIGPDPVLSEHGVVSSVAYKVGGELCYCLEGNINYTGAVITWLKDDVKLIDSPGETGELAKAASPEDHCYLVPAFSGLGAPYWDSEAEAALVGMTRRTGKAEIVRAALNSIAYQINDILRAMEEDAGIPIRELRVDGGPTANTYLMQFQSDLSGLPVRVPPAEELSGMGAAYAAGLALGVYRREMLFDKAPKKAYAPLRSEAEMCPLYEGWKAAVVKVLTR